MNIENILPEEISDESAYHLVEFFMNLALELESYYFGQLYRYSKESTELKDDFLIGVDIDEDDPF